MIVIKRITKGILTVLLAFVMLNSSIAPVYAEANGTTTKTSGYAGVTTDSGTLEFKPPDNVSNFGEKSVDEVGGSVIDTVRIIASGITGFLSILCLFVFIYHAFRLAMMDQYKPGMRKEYMKAIVLSVIGFALLGGTSLFIGLFYNLFA